MRRTLVITEAADSLQLLTPAQMRMAAGARLAMDQTIKIKAK